MMSKSAHGSACVIVDMRALCGWLYVHMSKFNCRAPMHQIEQAPSADLQSEQGSSGCSTAPESANSSTAMGTLCASAQQPDHAARIRVVLQARVIALLLRSLVRGVFRAWRGLVKSRPMHAQHHSDDELSVASASPVHGQHH